MMVNWANDGLIQANDGKMHVNDSEMVANDGEMSVWSYTHFTLINKHFTPIHEHFNITSLKQTIIRSYDSTDCILKRWQCLWSWSIYYTY